VLQHYYRTAQEHRFEAWNEYLSQRAPNTPGFLLRYEGLIDGEAGAASWALAIRLAAAFIAYAAWRSDRYARR